MNTRTPFLTLPCGFEQAITWAQPYMAQAGIQSLRTFDLRDARQARGLPCPQHGARGCDCQMAVLLVYQEDCQPLTLLVHSSNGETRLSVVDTPEQRANPLLESRLVQVLAAGQGFGG